ncbi:hypothetical protein [Roseateles sp.]|uniref:hypothetical protein n=1 Tax=Roseateles sp. TaxID=1971397 RepID=UPI0039EA886D
MYLNLADPESIVAWWRCFPERHWSYLSVFETRTPQFRMAIRSARQRIQADPLFNRARIAAFDAAVQAAWSSPADDDEPATASAESTESAVH